jgi:hypothetical protein
MLHKVGFFLLTIIGSVKSSCYTEVSINVSDIIFGLKPETPIEIIDSYIEASSTCMHQINKNNMKRQDGQAVLLRTGDNTICSSSKASCRLCGTIYETDRNCKQCCEGCRCVGCEWNRGAGTNWLGDERVCDTCCSEPTNICSLYYMDCFGCKMPIEGTTSCKECCGICRCEGCNNNFRTNWQQNMYGDYVCDPCCDRRLEGDSNLQKRRRLEEYEINVYYNMNICMDEITPLDTNKQVYTNHEEMLQDYNDELHSCYENKSHFIDTWASISANNGLDLSLMVRDDRDRDLTTILFGYTGMEINNAQVTTYSSSKSHRATKHMLFYGIIGFLVISIVAVTSTFIVVYKINKRKEENMKLLNY